MDDPAFQPLGRWVALLLLAVTACSPGGEGEAAADTSGKSKGKAGRPARVEVAGVKAGALTDRWSFLGDVRARARSELAAGAAGAVTRVLVREGDRVKRGQLLVEVDAALARARVRVARAREAQGREELEQARRELKRFERLGRKSVAAVELERARSRALALQAKVAEQKAATHEATAELERHRVVAPYDAVVARRRADPGDWVKPGDQLLDVVSLEQAEIIVDGSSRLLGFIAQGDDASIRVRGETIAGRVAGVVPALDPVARTARVRIEPKDPKAPRLLPGSVVSVAFSVRREGEGLVVPRDALIKGPVATRVVKVVDGKAASIQVEVLATADDQALVEGKLSVGDRVVVRGNERVRPGQPLSISE